MSDSSGNGWIWIKASRKLKSVSVDEIGHRAYLQQKRAEFEASKKVFRVVEIYSKCL